MADALRFLLFCIWTFRLILYSSLRNTDRFLYHGSPMTTLQPYVALIDQIGWLLDQSRSQVVAQVNQTMVMTYRTIGQYIVEYEQGWADRAGYGSGLLKRLAGDLTSSFWKGFWIDNLENMRRFYLNFPKSETLSRKFKLSRSHYIFLMRMNEQERMFYEREAVENNRSLRELKRQFDSGLFLRLALSKDKEWVKVLAEKWQVIAKPQDIVKDPYVLEFLWLKEQEKYSESDLEQAIIDKIENFLLELGKWFTFVGRQQRFTFDEKHFFVDLVFYNRLLQCFVVIDLKIGDLKHQDLWQMQMYVNYYDRFVKKDFENPTIWILLCSDKSDALVEITLPKESNVFASKYQLYLPNIEELKKLIEDSLHDL